MTERVLPVPDDESAPFWESAAKHVLTAARCSRCDTFSMPPGPVCPNCGSTEPGFTFSPLSGRGVIRSWTVVRQAFLPGFDDDIPFALVDVELDEQPELRLIGRLLDGLDIPYGIGTPVGVCFEDLGPGIALPAFAVTR